MNYVVKLAPNDNPMVGKFLPFVNVMVREALEEMRDFPPEIVEIYVGQLVGLIQYVADGSTADLPQDFQV